MFMIGARWTDPEPAHTPPDASAGQALATRPVVVATLLALLALALPVALRGQAAAQEATRRPELSLPTLSGWQRADASLPPWTPDFEHAAANSQTQWRKGEGTPVGLYVGYYRHQGRDSKLVTSTNVLVNPESNKVWNEVEHGQTQLTAGGEALAFLTAELRAEALMATVTSSASRLRVWQIYWINGRPVHSPWQAKLLGAWQRLMGQGDDAAVLIIYTVKTDGADALLADFVQSHWATLDTWMRGVRDRGRSR
jgi:EpsI family protein